MRKVHWFGRDDVRDKLRSSRSHECKLIVPVILPATETRLLQGKWRKKLHDKSPVVQSDHFQLSYIDENTPQQLHWHRLQVECYRSDSPMVVAALDVDERLHDSAEITVDVVPGGRVFVPPRFCHLVHLTGPTEVMLIRVEDGPLERDDHTCDDCPRNGCRCAEMAGLIKAAIAENL